jgi:hypothetical protein
LQVPPPAGVILPAPAALLLEQVPMELGAARAHLQRLEREQSGRTEALAAFSPRSKMTMSVRRGST